MSHLIDHMSARTRQHYRWWMGFYNHAQKTPLTDDDLNWDRAVEFFEENGIRPVAKPGVIYEVTAVYIQDLFEEIDITKPGEQSHWFVNGARRMAIEIASNYYEKINNL